MYWEKKRLKFYWSIDQFGWCAILYWIFHYMSIIYFCIIFINLWLLSMSHNCLHRGLNVSESAYRFCWTFNTIISHADNESFIYSITIFKGCLSFFLLFLFFLALLYSLRLQCLQQSGLWLFILLKSFIIRCLVLKVLKISFMRLKNILFLVWDFLINGC